MRLNSGTSRDSRAPAHVRLIERGERADIAATTATALARVLATTAEYLVDGIGAPPAADAVLAAVARARLAAQPPAAAESRPSHPGARSPCARTSASLSTGGPSHLGAHGGQSE